MIIYLGLHIEKQLYDTVYACALQCIIFCPQAVFLDDLGGNVKCAREVGMTTVRVRGTEKALRELEALLGVTLVEEDGGNKDSGYNLTEDSQLDTT